MHRTHPQVRVFRSHEASDESDRDYYRSLTPEQRLEILLELNSRWRHQDDAAPTGRLARVCRVIRSA